MPQSFLCFSVVPAGTVKHTTSRCKLLFSFSLVTSWWQFTVISQCLRWQLLAVQYTYTSRQHASLYTSDVCRSLLTSKHSFTKRHALQSPPPPQLDGDFWFYFIEVHTRILKNNMTASKTSAEQRPNKPIPILSLTCATSIHPFTPLSPADATSTATFGSWSSSISGCPAAHGSKGPEQWGGWGEGNGDNASFSSPVFGFIHSRCASTIVQGSKCSSTVQKFQEFDSLCIYYIYVSLQSHRSTMKALKRSLNTTLVRYYLFSPFQCMYWEHSGEIRKHFHCSPAARQPCQPPLNSRFTNSVQWLSGWKCWEKNNFIYG